MRTASPGVRAWFARAASVALAVATVVPAPALAEYDSPKRLPRYRTVVSLTFDDGGADQYAVRRILAAHRMTGTFYISSGLTGRDAYYMTWDQVRDLADDGNEIGGHSLDHVKLTTVPPAEQRRQVCEDRRNIIARGFHPTSFAYPESDVNPSVEAVVKDCGYRSGRAVGDVFCDGCVSAESVPPPDPYRTRTPDAVAMSTSLDDIERWVINAERHGGGWIQLVFHHICDGCSPDAISPSDFDALLTWLEQRTWRGTVVKTVAQALRGEPVSPSPSPSPTARYTS